MRSHVAKVFSSTAKAVAKQFLAFKKDDNGDPPEVTHHYELDALRDIAAIDNLLSGVTSSGGQGFLAELSLPSETDLFDQVNERAVEYAQRRSAELVSGVEQATRNELRNIIATGLKENIGMDAIAERIRDAYAFSADRAELIARTEITMANQAGALEGMKLAEKAGVKLKKVWLPDAEACDECVKAGDAGAIDLDGDFPGVETDAPPGHPRCLPGDALVAPCGNITAVSKRWFEGDLVIISTADGIRLSCTENHPILTPRGWLAARFLDEGSDIVRCSLSQGIGPRNDDNGKMPARIEDIAESFRCASGVSATEVKTTAPDFHGDGMGSQIAVIFSKSKLGDHLNPTLQEHRGKLCLEGAAIASLTHDAMSAPKQESVALFHTTDSIMSGGDLGDSPFRTMLGPSEKTGFTTASDGDARFAQNSSDNGSRDSKTIAQSQLRFPILIGCDDGFGGKCYPTRVTSIHKQSFAGYVFNLETTTGYFVAQGVIVHNCECSLISKIEESGEESNQGDEE